MYDLEKMNKVCNDIVRYFRDLDNIGFNEKNINDSEKFYAASMVMFGIINRTINLAEEILVKNDLPMPSNYHECFPSLAKAGFVNKEIATKLENLTKKRGVFAHYYFDVTPKDVLKLSKEIYIVKDFVKTIEKIIEENEK